MCCLIVRDGPIPVSVSEILAHFSVSAFSYRQSEKAGLSISIGIGISAEVYIGISAYRQKYGIGPSLLIVIILDVIHVVS